MKTQSAHAHEDRLLDFAYEELPASEARLVEQHLQGCSRCTEALAGIRGVRTSMARLTPEPAPEAGLDSLLAYAQQSARRSAAGAEPTPRWWRRLLTPALSVVAVSVFGVLVIQVNRDVDLSPALHKSAPPQSPVQAHKVEQANAPAASEVSASDAPAAAAPPPPVTAQALPSPEVAAQPSLRAKQEPLPTPWPTTTPSVSSTSRAQRREANARADWSNAGAGSAGGFPAKRYSQDVHESVADDDFDQRMPERSAKKGKEMMAPGQGVAPAPKSARPAAQDKGYGALDAEESKLAQGSPTRLERDRVGAVASTSGGASKDGYPMSPPGSAPAPSKADAEQVSREPSDSRSPSVGELLQQADTARRSGDSAQEVTFLRAALTAGLQGGRRVEVLSRLCEAEAVLGHRGNAASFCKQVMALAPGSREAQGAQRLLEGELQAPADDATRTKPAAPMAH